MLRYEASTASINEHHPPPVCHAEERSIYPVCQSCHEQRTKDASFLSMTKRFLGLQFFCINESQSIAFVMLRNEASTASINKRLLPTFCHAEERSIYRVCHTCLDRRKQDASFLSMTNHFLGLQFLCINESQSTAIYHAEERSIHRPFVMLRNEASTARLSC